MQNDSSYSSASYKHLNKAKKAAQIKAERKQSAKSGVGVTSQSYKAQNKKEKSKPVLIYPGVSNIDRNVTRNYKQQFKPTSKEKKVERIKTANEFPETVRNAE